MKTATLSEWEAIGEQAKKTRNELFELINQTSGKLPISLTNQIIKSIEHLDLFRCKAEDRMLQSGISDDLRIFYGGGSNVKN